MFVLLFSGRGPRTGLDDRPALRLIDAQRILGERVSGRGQGAGGRAAADEPELAPAAATLEQTGVAQRGEQRMVPVHVHERVGPDVAGRQRQEPARLDVAVMVDEEEAAAIA